MRQEKKGLVRWRMLVPEGMKKVRGLYASTGILACCQRKLDFWVLCLALHYNAWP